MRLRLLPHVLLMTLLLAGCAKDSADEQGNPTISVTGFRVFTNSYTSLTPSQPLDIPARQDVFVELSATLRDDNRLRGIRIRVEPDFAVTTPSTPTDSIWRVDLRQDTFSRAEVVLTNRRFLVVSPNLRRTNAPGGGPYRLRLSVTDTDGNVSDEFSQRINLVQ